ncbi:MAG: hypothetical protein ACTS6G_01480 [Candidatus Hodgkinia cicadicola]
MTNDVRSEGNWDSCSTKRSCNLSPLRCEGSWTKLPKAKAKVRIWSEAEVQLGRREVRKNLVPLVCGYHRNVIIAQQQSGNAIRRTLRRCLIREVKLRSLRY